MYRHKKKIKLEQEVFRNHAFYAHPRCTASIPKLNNDSAQIFSISKTKQRASTPRAI